MKRTIIIFCSLILMTQGYSQGMVRDGLVLILGQRIDAPVVQEFFNTYGIKHTAGAKYSSATAGIDIDTKKDSIATVNVYKSSPIYGSYTGYLSMGLKFGMIPAQVADKLGKPKTAYTNSGYSEYAMEGYILTCWFEQGALSQVSLSPR